MVRRKTKVMHGDQGRAPGFREFGKDLHGGDLMRGIEPRRRYICHQKRRVLRQGAGDQDPRLLLPPIGATRRAVEGGGKPHMGNRTVNMRLIAGRQRPVRGQMRQSAVM